MTYLILAAVGASAIGVVLIAVVCLAHRPYRRRPDGGPLLDRTEALG